MCFSFYLVLGFKENRVRLRVMFSFCFRFWGLFLFFMSMLLLGFVIFVNLVKLDFSNFILSFSIFFVLFMSFMGFFKFLCMLGKKDVCMVI